ncbi:MAG: cobalt ECF transporter T component CbiQ, partial [Angustibacter sp.]
PPLWVLRRSMIELPFVILALALPFTGAPPNFSWGPLTLSESGALAGWNILIKGTLGVVTSIALAATTTVPDLLLGLQRLRMPEILVQIAAFMVRYLEVISDQARRMQIARISRGHNPKFIWQAAVFAKTLGALFIRSFERGERVYLAMISRGYDGRLPVIRRVSVRPGQWIGAAGLPGGAALCLIATWALG